MSRARTARRIAAAAAYGGGGLSVLGGAVAALLVTEAKLARRWIGTPTGQPPAGDGVFTVDGTHGVAAGGEGSAAIRLVMLGDSSGAGLGVHRPEETPGVRLACGLAQLAGQPVALTNVARVGARSIDLDEQVTRALGRRPDVAVIAVGANDVIHRVRPAASVRHLGQAVHRLRAAGVAVVVGTCPDLGTIEPIAQPLRLVVRQWSRQLAAAQTIAVVEAGGRSVSLGDLLGSEFAAAPTQLFGPDRFHPSAEGYASMSAALLPSVAAALGLSPEAQVEPEAFRGDGVLPVAVAAAEAADDAGTEVAGTQVGGAERGPRGRWALLRHRRRASLPDVDDRTAAAASS